MNNPQEPEIDLNFRPESYWTTADPTLTLLEAITDPATRKRASELARAFDKNQISALYDKKGLTEEELTFFAGCGFVPIDDRGNVEPLEEPVDVAGAGFDIGNGFATSHFSVSILSKRCAGQAAVRVKGQGEDDSDARDVSAYDIEETSPDDWSLLENNQPLTLDVVAGWLEENLPHGSISLCLQGQLEAADDSVENTLERLEISADSSLYPELSELFSAKIEAWRQSVRDAEKISDA